MVMFQQCYTSVSYILFLPIVFIGAFFLINLLLAVVNSSFSKINAEESAKAMALKEKNKLRFKKKRQDDGL